MTAKKRRKLTKKIIALIVCACFICTVLLTALGFYIAFLVADGIQVWTPDYEMEDIEDILGKDELSDEDYELLYKQTGLTKTGIDRALAKGAAGRNRILAIQKDYFGEYEVINDSFAPYVCTDRIEETITHIYLEKGDIVVTSSTHIAGWRIGHSGLVVNTGGGVLQAMAYGSPSYIGNIYDFTSRVNFMILSVKTDDETKNAVIEYATENLIGLKYNGAAGILTNKNSIDTTQCAHLVWYAYSQFGIDLDSNGGKLVVPKNIANSPYVELVQVFGFDPVTLWSK